MPAQLVSLNGGPSFLLDKPILLVGRHPECDIQIDSRKISRRHCCIAEVNNYLVIRDLGSTNGIRINGARLVEGRLKDGDELTIAGFRYRVTWDMLGGLPAALPQAQPAQPAADRMPLAIPVAEGDPLEACDEPVALPEPAENRPVAPECGFQAASPRPAEKPPSFHIPSDLRLRPSSDLEVRTPHSSP
jgi:predicted component of type VI protein secretion system